MVKSTHCLLLARKKTRFLRGKEERNHKAGTIILKVMKGEMARDSSDFTINWAMGLQIMLEKSRNRFCV